MNELLDEFDELELRDERQYSEPESSYKGKQPKNDDTNETSDNEEDAIPQPSSSSHQPCPDSPSKASEPGDLTCAICLHDIQLENLAMVKGCDHIYCSHCILLWALHKEHPWCPQCKQEFNYLLTYRGIDGELHDFPVEESVVLLKRARWFEDSLRTSDIPATLLEDSRLADDLAWHDHADDYDFAEDEAIEAYYFSSAAGRARVLLGNRRFGEGGYISGGRRQARPNNNNNSRNNRSKGKGGGKPARTGVMAVVSSGSTPPLPPSSSSNNINMSSGSGSGSGSSAAIHATNPTTNERSYSSSPSSSMWLPQSMAVPINTPNANGGRKARLGGSSPLMSSSPSLSSELLVGSGSGSGGMIYGSSPSGSGRRARRNARRAAAAAAAATSTQTTTAVEAS